MEDAALLNILDVISGLALSCGFLLCGCRIDMSYQFDRKNIYNRTLKFNHEESQQGMGRVLLETQKNGSQRIVRSPGGCDQLSILSAFPEAWWSHPCLWPLIKEVCVMSAYICNSSSSPCTRPITHSPPQTRQHCNSPGVIVIIWDNKGP